MRVCVEFWCIWAKHRWDLGNDSKLEGTCSKKKSIVLCPCSSSFSNLISELYIKPHPLSQYKQEYMIYTFLSLSFFLFNSHVTLLN